MAENMRNKALVILSEARSGSNWLASLMMANKGWGQMREWLNPAVHQLPRRDRVLAAPLMQKIAAQAVSPGTGVLGIKVFTHQLMRFHQLYGFDPVQRLTLGRETLFLRLERRDRLAQAVSLEIARQSGAWKSTSAVKAEPSYDFAGILRAFHKISASYAFWDSYCSLRPVQQALFIYEDLIEDPTPWLAACAAFTGRPIRKRPPKPGRLAVQRDARNADWIARFQADLVAGDMGGADLLAGLYPARRSLPRQAMDLMSSRAPVRQFDL
jgi:LPS sulfotransferase NodH